MIKITSVGFGILGRLLYFFKKKKKIKVFFISFCFVGDSFTQFRFAEEKDWDTESIYSKQVTEFSGTEYVHVGSCTFSSELYNRMTALFIL